MAFAADGRSTTNAQGSNDQEVNTNNLFDTTVFLAYSSKYAKVLQKLPKNKVIALALGWLENPLSEPHISWIDYNIVQSEDDSEPPSGEVLKARGLQILKEEYRSLFQSTVSKKEIVQRILLDHWPRGLNMLQIAEIDNYCKLLFFFFFFPLRSLLTNSHSGNSELAIVVLLYLSAGQQW